MTKLEQLALKYVTKWCQVIKGSGYHYERSKAEKVAYQAGFRAARELLVKALGTCPSPDTTLIDFVAGLGEESAE